MRFTAILVLLTLAGVASANGAMGLGLELWDVRYWLAYVVVMVGAEAWLIGRWLELSWVKSIGLSVLANAITGVGCGLGGCPFLHPMSFPNPLGYSVGLMLVFALPSAGIEALLWNRFAGVKAGNRIVLRSFGVHLLLVPVGLAILLIPDRPFVGAERLTSVWRNNPIGRVKRDLSMFISDKGRLPAAQNPTELQAELKPYMDEPRDYETLLSTPVYGRFATDGRIGIPWDINPALRGRPIAVKEGEQWVWYARPQKPQPYQRQITVDLSTGNTDYTYDASRLRDLSVK